MIVSGHRRIGFITGLMRLSTSRERLDAYKLAMDNYCIPIEDCFIQQGNSMASSTLPLLQALLDAKCTAIVVSNNAMLEDVLFYLYEKNIRVGIDISILGQSVEGHKSYNLHNMDLVVQPSTEIGIIAGQQIIERIENADMPIRNTMLRSTLLKTQLTSY